MKYLFLALALLISAPDIHAESDPGKRRHTYGVSKKKKFTSCRKAKRIISKRHR
jgi:hypothetical protein